MIELLALNSSLCFELSKSKTVGNWSEDMQEERARGPVDLPLVLGSPSEGGSPRARPVGELPALQPEWCDVRLTLGLASVLFFYFFCVRRVPLTREWGRVSPTSFQTKGTRAPVAAVTVGKPRGFPRSVRSQRLFKYEPSDLQR